MSNTEMTVAPIPVERLKEIFKDKEQTVTINVTGSQLAPKVLLVYLTNLGLNTKLYFSDTTSYFETLKAYMASPMLHDFQQLEFGVIEVLLQYKGYEPTSGIDYTPLLNDEQALPLIQRWINIIESLSLYAMRWFNISTPVATYFDDFEKVEDKDIQGINFVHLLSYDQCPLIMYNDDPSSLKYYTYLFDDPVYKGMLLSAFWVSDLNVLFSITQSIQAEKFDFQTFNTCFYDTLNQLVDDHVSSYQ